MRQLDSQSGSDKEEQFAMPMLFVYHLCTGFPVGDHLTNPSNDFYLIFLQFEKAHSLKEVLFTECFIIW